MKYLKTSWGGVLIILGFFLWINPGSLDGAAKKFEVSSEKANIYLKPNKESSVIEILDKGAILTCDNPRKFRKCWNYVYFKSKKSGKTKSGYINDSDVKKLYKNKIIEIHQEKK